MKYIYTLFAALIISTSAFSQAEAAKEQPDVRFGIVLNPSLSWLKSSKIGQEGDGVSPAFGYGLHLEFRISDYVAVTTGISQSNYTGRVAYGQKDTVNLTYARTEAGLTLPSEEAQIVSRSYVFNSIELPFKLKFKTPEIGYMTYFAELGIVGNINYKVTAKKNAVILGGSPAELNGDLENIDVNDDTNWYRLGSTINVGAEYNFVGNTSLLVSVNWGNSFTSALRKESKDLSYQATGLAFTQSAKLDYIGLTVGFIF